MAKINCEDCWFVIEIGDGVRRSLIKHFMKYLVATIEKRGFNARDPLLFNRDVIEAEAWRLTNIVITRARLGLDGVSDELRSSERQASEIITEEIDSAVSELELEYLGKGRDDELSEINMLIERASGRFPELQ
jgi:hypothetical protein